MRTWTGRPVPAAVAFFLLSQLGIFAAALAFEPWSGKTTTRVNMRTAPSLTASVLTAVDGNRTVLVRNSRDGWHQIMLEESGYSIRGWVFGKYVRPQTGVQPSQPVVPAPVAPAKPDPVATTEPPSQAVTAPPPASEPEITKPPAFPAAPVVPVPALWSRHHRLPLNGRLNHPRSPRLTLLLPRPGSRPAW